MAENRVPDTMDETDFKPVVKRAKWNETKATVDHLALPEKEFVGPTYQTVLKGVCESGHPSSRHGMAVMLQRELESRSLLHELCRVATSSRMNQANDLVLSSRRFLEVGVGVVPPPGLPDLLHQREISLDPMVLSGQRLSAHWDPGSVLTGPRTSVCENLEGYTGTAQDDNFLAGQLLLPLPSLGNADASLSHEWASNGSDLPRKLPHVSAASLPQDQRQENRAQVEAGGPESKTVPHVDRASATVFMDALPYSKVSPMSVDTDKHVISEYQCLIRQQIEFFEACSADLRARAQGRNKPIYLKQVGIRCIHCAQVPPGSRPKGAVYFPSKLETLYQSTQNMANNHFNGISCQLISQSTLNKVCSLKRTKTPSMGGGGQAYWMETARDLGIVDSEKGGLTYSSALEYEAK